MINKNYFNNMPAKNVVRENDTKNLSEEFFYSKDSSLDNMILNSNLDNENRIK